ncbi:MAG: hypothetical protein ABL982_20790 [Vicinamibacterales bacterium]
MLPLRAAAGTRPDLTPAEEAIVRSVLYAAVFDYPLQLSQLRQTLIASSQTPSEIVAALRDSAALATLVQTQDGFIFPAGRTDLIEVRRRREHRSRGFLAEHGPLLRLIAALPYVRLLGLSGSVAHLNMESGGDLDIFIVTKGTRVWSTAVAVILLAKALGRRRTLCANFIVADTALAFDQPDLFSASQVINLKPLVGDETYRQLLDANPFVHDFYPNFHAPHAGPLRLRQSALLRSAKAATEAVCRIPSALVEVVCRTAYRAYLRRRSATWHSPEQVVLGDTVLKLHTRSHRATVLSRFNTAVSDL